MLLILLVMLERFVQSSLHKESFLFSSLGQSICHHSEVCHWFGHWHPARGCFLLFLLPESHRCTMAFFPQVRDWSELEGVSMVRFFPRNSLYLLIDWFNLFIYVIYLRYFFLYNLRSFRRLTLPALHESLQKHDEELQQSSDSTHVGAHDLLTGRLLVFLSIFHFVCILFLFLFICLSCCDGDYCVILFHSHALLDFIYLFFISIFF
jgi:hypothetical protein